MKAYLLYRDQDFDFAADLPSHHEDVIQDLNLEVVLETMAQGDRFLFEVAKRVVLTSLTDPDAILYRQRILADCLAQPDVVKSMYEIAVGALEDKRRIWGFTSSHNPGSILSSAVRQLEAFVVRLRQLRKLADEHVDSFRSDGLVTLVRTLQRELDDDYFDLIESHLKQLRFRSGIVVSAQLGWDNSGINYVLRSSGRARSRWTQRLGVGHRSSFSFSVPPRDEAGGNALAELTNHGINAVANAVAQSADHISSYFTMLRHELGFYVGCLNLSDDLGSIGESTSFPVPSKPSPHQMAGSDLRDVGLSLQFREPVVGNDVDTGGRSMVVVTGANSGGKSTFLRSVGLAQLMMQCGLFVAARSYQASVCTGVFTHFVREEDPTMSSGRLDEELRRMSSIADHLQAHCLMLFNESFSATNEAEGSEIGRQVVSALLEAHLTVVFVTHQYDFAESFQLHHEAETLFLRAERRPDGHRDFKLVAAGPLPTSFGEDIYYRVGRWLGEEDDRPAEPAAAGQESRAG